MNIVRRVEFAIPPSRIDDWVPINYSKSEWNSPRIVKICIRDQISTSFVFNYDCECVSYGWIIPIESFIKVKSILKAATLFPHGANLLSLFIFKNIKNQPGRDTYKNEYKYTQQNVTNVFHACIA